MICKIRNEDEWRRFVWMMQTRFQRDMQPWDSIRKAGDFSQTTDLCLEMQGLDPDAVDIDADALQTGVRVIGDEYDELRDEIAEKGDEEKEQWLCDTYDHDVAELILNTVKPRYPVLALVDVLHVHGDVRSMIDERLLVLRVQRDADEAPDTLPLRMWREAGNRTPEELVEDLKKDPSKWTAMVDGAGAMAIGGVISSVCVAVKQKLEFVGCRLYEGRMWRVCWREDGRKTGITIARIEDA